MPLCKKTQRRGGRFVSEVGPLFPGYLFVGVERMALKWRTLNSTRGVSKVVNMDGNYQPINTNVIRNLKSKCDPNDVFCFKNQFNPGDNVKLINGPFTNFLARIEQVAPNENGMASSRCYGKIATSKSFY